jgi:iron complex transport system substrate-binding protein
MAEYPTRIVCLTEETTETLYLLGEGDRVVGVSGYTMRPVEARQKPRVSAFTHARYEQIAALDPDLILAFSDLQADIAADLIRRGYPVVVFNQRSVQEILQMIRMLGGLIGCADRACALAARLEHDLEMIRAEGERFAFRPRVYFEEWDDPLISGIRWVEELVTIAGGAPIFPELADASLAKQRIVPADEVIRRDPEVIIASWCGKPVRRDAIVSRPGWERIAAVQRAQVHEIKSTIVLQPGPAALSDGVRAVQSILQRATAGGSLRHQ